MEVHSPVTLHVRMGAYNTNVSELGSHITENPLITRTIGDNMSNDDKLILLASVFTVLMITFAVIADIGKDL